MEQDLYFILHLFSTRNQDEIINDIVRGDISLLRALFSVLNYPKLFMYKRYQNGLQRFIKNLRERTKTYFLYAIATAKNEDIAGCAASLAIWDRIASYVNSLPRKLSNILHDTLPEQSYSEKGISDIIAAYTFKIPFMESSTDIINTYLGETKMPYLEGLDESDEDEAYPEPEEIVSRMLEIIPIVATDIMEIDLEIIHYTPRQFRNIILTAEEEARNEQEEQDLRFVSEFSKPIGSMEQKQLDDIDAMIRRAKYTQGRRGSGRPRKGGHSGGRRFGIRKKSK